MLTLKQKRVYDFLSDYIKEYNKAPYIREVQEGCKIPCYKSVVDKLLALERKGYIKRSLNKHRSIRLNNIKREDD